MAIKRNLRDPLAKSEFDYNPSGKSKKVTRGGKTIEKTKSRKGGIVTKTKRVTDKKTGEVIKEKTRTRRTVGKFLDDVKDANQARLDAKLKRKKTKAEIKKAQGKY
tara:strand:- start:186 stop:503 length:318 start_codon:yes stop_codon:yes gene_type:complete